MINRITQIISILEAGRNQTGKNQMCKKRGKLRLRADERALTYGHITLSKQWE